MWTLNIIIRRYKVWQWLFKKKFYYFWNIYGIICYAAIFILSITMLFMIVINYMFSSYLEQVLTYLKAFLSICALLFLPLLWSNWEDRWSIEEELKNFYFVTFLTIIVFCILLSLCLPIKFTIIISLIIFLEELLVLVFLCESLAWKEFEKNWASDIDKFYEAWLSMDDDYRDITDIHIQDRNTLAPWCCFLAILIIILLGPLAWGLLLMIYADEAWWQNTKSLYYIFRLPINEFSSGARSHWVARAAYMKEKVDERVQACEHAAFNAYVKALTNAAEVGVYKTPEAYKGAIAMAIYAAEKAGATNEEANNIAKKTHIFNQHVPIAKAGAISTEFAQNSPWKLQNDIELRRRVDEIWLEILAEAEIGLPGSYT